MKGHPMKSWTRKRVGLLLCLVGLAGHVRSARAQATDLDQYQTGAGTRASAGSGALLRNRDSLAVIPPGVGSDLYQQALADFRAGRLEQASEKLRTLDSAPARNALGVVLEKMGDQRGAMDAFQEALNRQPNSPEASFNAARLYLQQGRSSAAIYPLQSALTGRRADNSTMFSLQMLLVQAYGAAGQDKQNAELLQKLLAEHPESADLHLNLAITDAHLGKLEAAIAQFCETLRLEPDNTTALMGVSKALLRARKPAEALPYLLHYTRLRPEDPEGYFVTGCDWRDANQPNQAAATFAQATRLSPSDYDAEYHLGMALWHSGNLQASLTDLRAAENLKPDDIKVHSALAQVLQSLGHNDQARAESSLAEKFSARKARQSEADLDIVNGGLLLERGDLRGAAQEFRQALECDPESAPAHSNLGLVLSHLNDPQGARGELESAIALNPKLVLAHNALGLLYMQEGRTTDAAQELEAAIRINPQYAEAKNNLGTLDAKLGKSAEAIALLQEAVEDSPQYPQAYLNLGLVLASQGELARAKPVLEKALQLAPNLGQANKALEFVNQNLKGPG